MRNALDLGNFAGIVGIAPVLSVFGGWLGSRYCVLYVLYYINIILVLNIMEPCRPLSYEEEELAPPPPKVRRTVGVMPSAALERTFRNRK